MPSAHPLGVDVLFSTTLNANLKLRTIPEGSGEGVFDDDDNLNTGFHLQLTSQNHGQPRSTSHTREVQGAVQPAPYCSVVLLSQGL